MKSVTKTIEDIQREIQGGELFPERASEILVTLSALMGNILEEIRQRDMDYNMTLKRCLEEHLKANRAKIEAQVSPEWMAMKKAHDTKDIALEMIRALKYFLKSKSEEYQTTKYQ